jgi:hypothetical protein
MDQMIAVAALIRAEMTATAAAKLLDPNAPTCIRCFEQGSSWNLE